MGKTLNLTNQWVGSVVIQLHNPWTVYMFYWILNLNQENESGSFSEHFLKVYTSFFYKINI